MPSHLVQLGNELLTSDTPRHVFTLPSEIWRPISRRFFLMGGAAFGTTAAPLMQIASAAVSPLVRLRRHHNGVVLDTEDARFAISPDDFGSDARLAVLQTGTRWEMTLSQARFPGSELSANFHAVSDLKNGVRFIEFRFPDWGFRARAPLAAWMRGHAPLQGSATWNAAAHQNGVQLHLTQAQTVEFAPDFSVRASNPSQAAVAFWKTGAESGAAAQLHFGLLSAGKRGIAENKAPHRSFWTLQRGEHPWATSQLLSALSVLKTHGDAFDVFNFELGENAQGTRSLALLANSKAELAPSLWVKPTSRSRLALRHPHFFATLDGLHTQVALLGWISPSFYGSQNNESEWQMGLDGDATPFSVALLDKRLVEWNCDARITEFHSAPRDHSFDFEAPALQSSSLSRRILVDDSARARIAPPLELQSPEPQRPIEVQTQIRRIPVLRPTPTPSPTATPTPTPAPSRGRGRGRRIIPGRETPSRETPSREVPSREVPTPTPAPSRDTPTEKRGSGGILGGIIKRIPKPDTNTDETPDTPTVSPSGGRVGTERVPPVTTVPPVTRVSPTPSIIKIPPVIKIPPMGKVPPVVVTPVAPPVANPPVATKPPLIQIPPLGGKTPIAIDPNKMPDLSGMLKSEVEFVRPDDLLKLRFRFVGLSISGDKIVRTSTGSAYVVVEWDALSLAEEVFPLGGTLTLPAARRAGGVSSLAFLTPSTFNNVALTLENLLDWSTWTQVNPSPTSVVHNPLEVGSPESALELPYRMQMAPIEKVSWLHSKVPKASKGVIELWHTRAQNATQSPLKMRAFNALEAPPTFNTSMEGGDQKGIVNLMATSSRWFEAENLMISTLGGFLRGSTKGDGWNDPTITISAWNHRTSLGRDHYVRVVKEGYLYPLGHRAAQITIVERTFENVGSTKIAVLRKRVFVIVRERVKDFRAGFPANYARLMPFTRVEILLPSSPNLNTSQAALTALGQSSPMMWPLAGFDETGARTEWAMPLVWVQRGQDSPVKSLPLDDKAVPLRGDSILTASTISKVWNQSSLGECDFKGQKLAFAPAKIEGDTTFAAQSVRIGAFEVPPKSAGDPAFFPQVLHADITVPALQNLGASTAPTTRVAYATQYRDTGFSAANAGEALLRMVKGEGNSLTDQAISLALGASKGGGVAQTALDMTGLSRLKGPVGGDLAKIAANVFDPKQYFGSMLDEARLLGSLKLSDVLKATGLNLGDAPQMVTHTIDAAKDAVGAAKDATQPAKDAANELSIPKEIRTTLKWQTDGLQAAGIFEPSSTTKLDLFGEIVVNQSGQTATMTGKLNDFAIDFFSFVRVSFVKLEFIAKSGQKLDINCDLAPTDAVTFGGPLGFIQTLASIIPSDRFSDPPSLDISPSGITAGYTLAAPDIAAGAWALSNLSFGAALTIPFSSDPCRLRFNFCERNDPFAIAAYGLTGGGFFALCLGTDGIERLEASFEIGGSLKINFGVVKGGVYIMAGIYFELREADKAVVLAGYVRAGGALSVLGLISMSLEMLMQLSYDSGTNLVRGEVSMKVKVSIAFFSKSVSFTAHKEFEAPAAVKGAFDKIVAQSDFDRPRLAAFEPDALTQAGAEVDDYWARYCAAFA